MGNIIVAVQTKLLKNICLFSGQNMQFITCVIRVTWHWGHPPLSLGFVRGHKSIVQLLLTINCALKFYSLFMMCNVMWFMWTQWVTGSNCGCFFADCALTATSQKLQLPKHFQQPGPLAVQTLHCWTPRARKKNASQPLSLRTDEGKSKPCFLTHGGDSVLIATLFPHMKHSDRKSGDGQRLWLWSILQWLDVTFMLMILFLLFY